MREAMSGADWVIHAAAELDFGAARDRIKGANVAGSENVASLAYKLGVGRVLVLSSVAAFGGSPEDGSVADETSSPQLPLPSTYSATKRAGAEIFRGWGERGLRVNTVYPGFVYGPPGRKGGLNATLRSVVKRRMPAIVGGGSIARWIYLDDLVEGLVRVLERAQIGENYLLTGDAATIGEVIKRTADLAEVLPPRWHVSVGTARLLAFVIAPFYRMRGFRSPINPRQLESLRRHWNFEDRKARLDLDWTPRGLDAGLPETIRYLRQV